MLKLIRGAFQSKSGALVEEARERLAQGAMLLDVRTPREFAAGHIDGAINIPVAELGLRLAELGDRSQPVVVYCRSGARSAVAKGVLLRSGFATVVDVGSMSALSS